MNAKTLILLFVISMETLLAQPRVFQGGVELQSSQGKDQASREYVMKGPYALRWTLRDVKPTRSVDSLAAYWKPHTTANPPWISIKVVDAVTRETVESKFVEAYEDQMQVSDGGRHCLIVTGEEHVAWTVWGKEGRLTNSGSSAAASVKVNASDIGGGTAQSAAEKLADTYKGALRGTDLETRLAAVRLIESRSASAQDFCQRWAAYSRTQGW